MTQDEIIDMARQADIDHHRLWNDDGTNRLEAFAKLVAAKEREEFAVHAVDIARRAIAEEREACAVIAEEWFCGCGRGSCPEGDRRAHDIANSIRERDEA